MSRFLINLALFGPFVGLLLTSIALIVAVGLRRIWLVIPFIALLILWAIVGPEIMAYSFGGGFGAGSVVIDSVPPGSTVVILAPEPDELALSARP